jgi:hypothetical protein
MSENMLENKQNIHNVSAEIKLNVNAYEVITLLKYLFVMKNQVNLLIFKDEAYLFYTRT